MVSISSNTSLSRKNRDKTLLFLILLIAVGTRLFYLGHYGMWFDEAFTWHLAHISIPKIIELARIDNTPPLYHILLNLWMKTGVSSDFMVRIPALIFGVIAVFWTYKLGHLLYDTQTALLSALITALSFSQMHYSQENRMYSLQIMLGLMSTFYFVKGLRTGRIIHYLGWLFSSLLLFYNHLFAVFLIGGQWVFFLINLKYYRVQIKNWLIFNLLLGLGCAYWLPVIFHQMGVIQDDYWVAEATIIEVIKVGMRFFGGTDLGNRYILTALLNIPLLLAAGLGISAMLRRNNCEKYLLLVLFLFPIVAVYIMSQVRQSLFYYRYFIFIVPYLHIIMALGLTKLRLRLPRIILFASVIIVSLIFLVSYYAVPTYSRPNRLLHREAAFALQKMAAPGEALIHQGPGLITVESYYIFKRYLGDSLEHYVWLNRQIPFFCGGVLYDEKSLNISETGDLAERERIWVATVILGEAEFNEYGLPVFESKTTDPQRQDILKPDKLWRDLSQAGFILKTREQFDKIWLFEFVKGEGN